MEPGIPAKIIPAKSVGTTVEVEVDVFDGLALLVEVASVVDGLPDDAVEDGVNDGAAPAAETAEFVISEVPSLLMTMEAAEPVISPYVYDVAPTE